MNKNNYKIGDKVWYVKGDCTIDYSSITSISLTDKGTEYTLEDNRYNSIKEVFDTEAKAKRHVTKLTKDFKYKIGDFVLTSQGDIAKIVGISVAESYTFRSYYQESYEDDDCDYWSGSSVPVVKIKESVLKQYEDVRKLNIEYAKKHKEIRDISNKLNGRYNTLNKELNTKYKLSKKWFSLAQNRYKEFVWGKEK